MLRKRNLLDVLICMMLTASLVICFVACGKDESGKVTDGPEVKESVPVEQNEINAEIVEPEKAETKSGNDGTEQKFADPDETKVAELVYGEFGKSFKQGFKESLGDYASVELKAEGTGVVLKIKYMTIDEEAFMTVNEDELQGMVDQILDEGSLFDTFHAVEPAVSMVTVEIYSSDNVLVASGERK